MPYSNNKIVVYILIQNAKIIIMVETNYRNNVTP